MINNENIQARFDLEPWAERIAELKELQVTGVCFYTDGGQRVVNYVSRGGFGIHAYFFNDNKPEGLGGFKLDYPTRLGYVEKKACNKEDTVNVCKFYNAFGNINGATSPVAELEAFIQAGLLFLNTKMYEFCKLFVLRSDCELVVKGINEYLQGWKVAGWKKSDGRQVKNLHHWKKIDGIIAELNSHGVKLDINHVYGHKFDTGNNISDQMATLGLYQNKLYGDEWVGRADFHQASVDFNPLLIDSKLLYYPARNIKCKGDGKYYHFIYSNNNNQDDINEVGRNLVDACIGFVITDDDQPQINALYDSCQTLDVAMSMTPKVVDLNIATKPSIQLEIREDHIQDLPRKVDKKDIRILTTSEKVAFVVLDPPRNSYYTQKNVEKLLETYRLLKGGLEDDFKELDITDLLFDTEVNGKGVTKYKFKVMESPSIAVDLPCWKEDGVKHFKTPLTFGLDLPRRRVFSNIKHLNPKVSVFTWYENDKISYFATIVQVDGAVGVWCAEHTNSIITEEL